MISAEAQNMASPEGAACTGAALPLPPAVTCEVLTDPLWARLGDAERDLVAQWRLIASRLEGAEDKGLELARIRRDFAGVVRGLSRGSIYRKVAALASEGAAGVLGAAALRRLGARGGCSLPPAFVSYWRERCASHQRKKALTVWHGLMRDLRTGMIIPGYEKDWRGIWLAEHPAQIVPAVCPYSEDHRAGRHPKGWSYRNLKTLAPEMDVWTAVAEGEAKRRSFLPSVPHTRVGLLPMQVITMDDVWHDVEVLFLHGHAMPTHERPVEVGVLDVLTGAHVAWQVWPVLRREDGSRAMVDWTVQRFLQAQIFCGIGIAPTGVTELLEHGTAGLSDKEIARINAILSNYRTPPAGRAWLHAERSSTTGAPIGRGLFVESAAGNPRHKAMLESSWNLLHNELAALPAQVGKDREHAPADAEGVRREDRALMAAVNEVAREHPEALEVLVQAEFHAVSFLKFREALRRVKDRINARTGHDLQGWEACGFCRAVAELPGGQEIDLDALPPAKRGAAAELIKTLGASTRLRRMSPAEAFAAATASTRLVRFPMAAAMEILGAELAQEVTVGKRGTLMVRDRFSGEALTYVGVATTEEGRKIELARGAKVRVWANPFARDALLVADLAGRAIGLCRLLSAAQFGDAEGDRANLGLWQEANAAQKARLEPLLAPKKARAAQTRRQVAELITKARSMPPAEDLQASCKDAEEAMPRVRLDDLY